MRAAPALAAALAALLAAPGLAGEPQRPANPCLTCPKPEPACWMMLYRWQDYNLRGGLGTHLVVTDGPPPDEADLARAKAAILRTLPPNHSVTVDKSNRVACPAGIGRRGT
jgi:hypothetical protein